MIADGRSTNRASYLPLSHIASRVLDPAHHDGDYITSRERIEKVPATEGSPTASRRDPNLEKFHAAFRQARPGKGFIKASSLGAQSGSSVAAGMKGERRAVSGDRVRHGKKLVSTSSSLDRPRSSSLLVSGAAPALAGARVSAPSNLVLEFKASRKTAGRPPEPQWSQRTVRRPRRGVEVRSRPTRDLCGAHFPRYYKEPKRPPNARRRLLYSAISALRSDGYHHHRRKKEISSRRENIAPKNIEDLKTKARVGAVVIGVGARLTVLDTGTGGERRSQRARRVERGGTPACRRTRRIPRGSY